MLHAEIINTVYFCGASLSFRSKKCTLDIYYQGNSTFPCVSGGEKYFLWIFIHEFYDRGDSHAGRAVFPLTSYGAINFRISLIFV